jgi:hypothetical protein
MNRFLRAACACRLAAAWIVPRVSLTSSGDTSSDTQPSTPPLASCAGRNMSAACCRSSTASAKNRSSVERPSRAICAIASSYASPWPIAFSKIVGLDVSPVTE